MSNVDASAVSPHRRTATDVAVAAQLACLLEASAPKPGNVSPGRHFSDARYEDFLASAAAIGGPLAAAGERPLGTTIRLAVEATSRWARSNTNLGIVLLLAPLARAAFTGTGRLKAAPTSAAQAARASDPQAAPTSGDALRCELRRVLDATTVADAREVYAAIRIASPGGLGQVDAEDV